MSTVIIKPYIDKAKDTIGLSEIGLNSFPQTSTITEIPIINGKYLTGFDINAFYLDSIINEEDKKREIKRIQEKIKTFSIKYPHLRVEDVNVIRDHNGDIKANPFYLDLLIELKSDITVLNTDNPDHLVIIEIIKTNAKYNPSFEVAPDLVTAKNSNKKYKFYIANADLDVEKEVSHKKEINKAVSILDTISSEDKERFVLMVQHLLPANRGISTESDNRLYKRADDYINGIVDGEKVKGGDSFYKNFIKTYQMDRGDLLNKVVIKYAIHANIIRFNNKTKDYLYVTTGQELGKTPEEIFNYLTQSKNLSILNDIKEDLAKEIKIV